MERMKLIQTIIYFAFALVSAGVAVYFHFAGNAELFFAFLFCAVLCMIRPVFNVISYLISKKKQAQNEDKKGENKRGFL